MHPIADVASVVAFITAPSCRPPAWEDTPEPVPDWDLLGQREFDFEFDQRRV